MASTETFKPGLFDIGLNIENLSNSFLLIERKDLTYRLELEPIYIKPAIRNINLVVLFHMYSGRTDARLKLEELVRDYPNDLNALADLIHVYQKMGRERDSDRYKKQLELQKDDQLMQARSILGQALALVYDYAGNHNKTPMTLLKDTWKTAHEKKAEANRIAVEKYARGIEMLKNLNCSKEEILVWKHNHAIAMNELDCFTYLSGNDRNSFSENCVKALEINLDVIEHFSTIKDLEGPLKRYLAESLMQFAGLSRSCRDYIDHTHLPERIKSQDLDSMCCKAMSICPNDPYILLLYSHYQYSDNKYLEAIKLNDKSISLNPNVDFNWSAFYSRGSAYFAYSKELLKRGSDQDQVNKYLELACKDIKHCLQSTCSETCIVGILMMDMALVCFWRAVPDNKSGVRFCCQNIDYIHEALDTLKEALNKCGMSKDSRIHSELGMYYPYIGDYKNAIKSLKTALELKEWSKESGVFSTLCKCFVAFFERENDKDLLIEFCFMLKEAKKRGRDIWVTDAMNMMFQNNLYMVTDLVQHMIKCDARGCEMLIKEALNKSFSQNLKLSSRVSLSVTCQLEPDVVQKEKLHIESFDTFIVEESDQKPPESNKICRNLSLHATATVCLKYQHNHDLVQNTIKLDMRQFYRLIDEKLMKYAKQNPPESHKIFQNLRRQFETKLQERNNQETDINRPMEIQISQNTGKFQYDFFVSHSENDSDWVNCMLLQQLEKFDDKIKFKGYIQSRDSVLGKFKTHNMTEGIKQSRNLLIVLTPAYLEDNWEQLVMQIMIFSAVHLLKQTIIPIVLKECEIPLILEPFNPIFFTEKIDWEKLQMRLTVNMDSETGLEEKMSALTVVP